MGEETTQQLFVAGFERLTSLVISLAEESNRRLERFETRFEARMASLESRMDSLESRMDSLESRLLSVEENQATLKSQFEALDAKVEKRLQDTRPIWENIQTHLEDLDRRTTRIEAAIPELQVETANGFRVLDRRIGVLSKNLIDMTAEIRELQDRVEPHIV